MKIFLDSSDVEEVTKAVDTGLIDGVTTNPSLMLKSGEDPLDVLGRITELFGWDASVSAEVSGETATELLDMAEEYIPIHPSITIKVPCTVEGLIACKDLAEDNIPVNTTLVFSTAQAILASKAGSTYISPFVGRVDDNSFDGLGLISDIVQTFEKHDKGTQVLAASLRNVRDVARCYQVGADIVTMPPKVFWGMYKHVLTDVGLAKFNADWAEVQRR
jgi:transaldolase|tara:strand:- start:611 stop:1264 length:654 start_codon:yes stop_codon:yes gene_type:complete